VIGTFSQVLKEGGATGHAAINHTARLAIQDYACSQSLIWINRCICNEPATMWPLGRNPCDCTEQFKLAALDTVGAVGAKATSPNAGLSEEEALCSV
jgi:hypothetical protein